MKKELITTRISPVRLAELENIPGSREAVDQAFHYDRIYTSFFGLLNAQQKKSYISRFEHQGVKITRLRSRIWRVCETHGLLEDDVLEVLARNSKNPFKRTFWMQAKIKTDFVRHLQFESFKQDRPLRPSKHHIIPKSRGGTLKVRNWIETELHGQLHSIFGVMLADEKVRMIDWYERNPEEIVEDSRIPYRFHPNERLLLTNIRSAVMQSEFSRRLALENETRAAYSYLTLAA